MSVLLDGAGKPNRCDVLTTPSTMQTSISCAIIALIIISYIPQYLRLIRRRSAEGLSSLFILLGTSSAVCATANILLNPSTRVRLGCCHVDDGLPCLGRLLGAVQVIVGALCFWAVLLLYAYFARDEHRAELDSQRPLLSSPLRTMRRAERAWLVLLLSLGLAFAILVVSVAIVNLYPVAIALMWTEGLGYVAALLACVSWMPQLWTTWHLGHLGSLSVVGLGISLPCTILTGLSSLLSRPHLPHDSSTTWSTHLRTILIAAQQLCLILIAIYFALRDRKEGRPAGKNTTSNGAQGNAWLPGMQDDVFVDYSGSRTRRREVEEESMLSPRTERTPLLRERSGE